MELPHMREALGIPLDATQFVYLYRNAKTSWLPDGGFAYLDDANRIRGVNILSRQGAINHPKMLSLKRLEEVPVHLDSHFRHILDREGIDVPPSDMQYGVVNRRAWFMPGVWPGKHGGFIYESRQKAGESGDHLILNDFIYGGHL